MKYKYKMFCMLKSGEVFIRTFHGVEKEFIFADVICSWGEKIEMIWETFIHGLTHRRSNSYIPWWEIVKVRR